MRLNEIIGMFINMGLIVRTMSSFIEADYMTRDTKEGYPPCATDILK